MFDEQEIAELLREAEANAKALGMEIGIDHKWRPVRTVYNEASETIVVSVEQRSKMIFERAVFYRHRSERTYRRIGSVRPEIHHENLISSPTRPFVYYSVKHVPRIDEIGEFVSESISVDRFDLTQGVEETVIKNASLQIPQPYSYGWVSQLLSVAADESTIFCSCRLTCPNMFLRHHYWLCSVDLHSLKVALLSRLEAGRL